MKQFVFSGLQDIRGALPRKHWEIGRRVATNYITLHYNGPAVLSLRQRGDGLMVQLRADCAWQMRAGWGTSKDGADGLQYHFVVAADGLVYQTRDLDALLWHCGNRIGNAQSIALHFPLGKGKATGVHQDATEMQWSAAVGLIEALRAHYGIALANVVGHQEWKSTECPGPEIMGRLLAWRGERMPYAPTVPVLAALAGVKRYKVISTDSLNVRFGRGTSFGIAGTLPPGREVWIDDITAGWAHMARIEHEQGDLGFVAARYLAEVA